MRFLRWRLRGWRKVWSGMVYLETPQQREAAVRDLIPDEAWKAISQHGGPESVRVTLCIGPWPFAPNVVAFTVWASKRWRKLAASGNLTLAASSEN
jgi:hypothetical protein